MDMHGFFSQGYAKSTKNDVIVGSENGTWNLREFGVNFAGYLTNDIMLAAQIMGYNIGGQGGDEIALHYGLADWQIEDFIGIRAGRYRVPTGLYNETRDVDMLRTSVFLPQTIYPEYFRDYFSACDGVTLYGNVNLNELGYMYYQAGTGNVVAKENSSGDVSYNAQYFRVTKMEADNPKSYNLQLLWETPLDGLRAGYTWRRIDAELVLHNFYSSDNDITFDTYNESQDNRANHVYSLEYVIDKLTLMYEFNLQRKDSIDQSRGWYIGTNYEFNEKFSAGFYYTEYDVMEGNKNRAETDAHVYSFFGRYNLTDSWLIKAQLDFNDGNGTSQWPAKLNVDHGGDSIMISFKTTWAF
ncbi:MAG: hypothetical protein MJB14_16625 [Spirochaetes bacterium]|nr:hypothetical protein [Spirochaetota bacterium]